ncbi:hypothetical protein PHISCL_04305 [Aspergillus sclerotialis]|uniref:Uncharacterized protein n=1 Tax=Aspergillus sclerotialis TaxID=2070753 RepID=A0A3A2ZM32_9EURO|nr:hypothetical protein PHISCL_04305 [Aspergillus sclerotialis]
MRRQHAPDSVFESNTLLSAVKVGTLAGAAGLVYGGVAGVFRSSHPGIHSLSRGIHWFACGTTFWCKPHRHVTCQYFIKTSPGLRSSILELYYKGNASPLQRADVSAIAGGIAGGGVTRLLGGRLAPALIVSSFLGYAGQRSYNAIDAWQLEQANTPSRPFLQQLAESKWIPLKSLSDEDYKAMLNQKILNIETEMALIDDKIEELQKSKSTESGKAPSQSVT